MRHYYCTAHEPNSVVGISECECEVDTTRMRIPLCLRGPATFYNTSFELHRSRAKRNTFFCNLHPIKLVYNYDRSGTAQGDTRLSLYGIPLCDYPGHNVICFLHLSYTCGRGYYQPTGMAGRNWDRLPACQFRSCDADLNLVHPRLGHTLTQLIRLGVWG